MDQTRLLARAFDQQLRLQAAGFSSELYGRKRSAAALDETYMALLEALDPSVFLEVGAFEATASRRVKATRGSRTVIAFEASPRNHRQFVAELTALGIEYRHAAVSDTTGTVRLRENLTDGIGLRGANSLLTTTDDSVLSRPVDVPAVTLDTAVPRPPSRGVAMWIDVEGHATSVLRGGRTLLPSVDLLKVEVEDRTHWKGQGLAIEVIEQLLEHGLIPVMRDIEYPGQYNVVFVSQTVLDQGRTLELIDDFYRSAQHSLHADPHRLRNDPRLRQLARPLRRGIGRVVERISPH